MGDWEKESDIGVVGRPPARWSSLAMLVEMAVK